MLNLVIINKDLDYSRNLINYLSNVNVNLRVLGILVKIEELFDIMKRNTIDIIIINSNEVCFNFLQDKRIKPYLKSTILISKSKQTILGVYEHIQNENDIKAIINSVNRLEKIFYTDSVKDCILIKAIQDELRYLHIKIGYMGVRYLSEAICLLYNLENSYDLKLEKDIYPIIAQKHHKKVSNIKSNINYAIDMLYAECEENILKDYLNEYSLCKISPKKVIFSILNNVKKELEEVKV